MLRPCLCRGNEKKKSSKSTNRSRNTTRVDLRGPGTSFDQQQQILAEFWQSIGAEREQIEGVRATMAAVFATDLVADLVTALADQPDLIVADELCSRLGTLLATMEHDEPIIEQPGPNDMARAVVLAAENAVRVGIGQPDAWRAPWQILTAMAGILPSPESESALEVIARLREDAGGAVLPPTPSGPEVTGPVLWTRDRYGSRFGVTAPITVADQPQRWYRWDVDACGHGAFTVHSGWYPTADAALTDWQDGVGPVAAAGTALAPVDDPWLLADLLPAEDEMFRIGGENAEQFAEHHRSKRFAEAAMSTMRLPESPPDRGLDPSEAAASSRRG